MRGQRYAGGVRGEGAEMCWGVRGEGALEGGRQGDIERVRGEGDGEGDDVILELLKIQVLFAYCRSTNNTIV